MFKVSIDVLSEKMGSRLQFQWTCFILDKNKGIFGFQKSFNQFFQ